MTQVSPEVGRCQHFSCALGKKRVCHPESGEERVRGTAAEKEIMVDRRRNTSIHVSCDASLLSFPGEKMDTVTDEWPHSQEKNRAELAPRD